MDEMNEMEMLMELVSMMNRNEMMRLVLRKYKDERERVLMVRVVEGMWRVLEVEEEKKVVEKVLMENVIDWRLYRGLEVNGDKKF